MKYLVLVPDGASDRPVGELCNRTPLEAARIPNMDAIARGGVTGTALTIPDGLTPGSDVANLSLLGYDPAKFYTGRGPLEAAAMGIRLAEGEVAFRCNLVTIEGTPEDGRLVDYSAGHITTEEAKVLIEAVGEGLSEGTRSRKYRFYPGVSYRHLMVADGGGGRDVPGARELPGGIYNPPHDVVGRDLSEVLPAGPQTAELVGLMRASVDILSGHPVNLSRRAAGKPTANMIWLWGQGVQVAMPTFGEKYGLTGGVISAVDLVKGIARSGGLEVVDVPGATGYLDTDYGAKARYALDFLEDHDFVFVHVEAPDEAGHSGDPALKVAALEDFDSKLVGPILEGLDSRTGLRDQGRRILLAPDHPTPLSTRTHSRDPVPFAIYPWPECADEVGRFDETAVHAGSVFLKEGHKLLDLLLSVK